MSGYLRVRHQHQGMLRRLWSARSVDFGDAVSHGGFRGTTPARVPASSAQHFDTKSPRLNLAGRWFGRKFSSAESELPPLLIPVEWQARIANQPIGRQTYRLPTFENGGNDVRCQIRQPDQSRDVRAVELHTVG